MLKLLVLAIVDVAAGLLGLAGLIKLSDPQPWVDSLAGLGVPVTKVRGPARRGLGRAVGTAEVVIATGTFVAGGRAWLVLLATAYAAFTFVSWVARRGDAASCGCFGASSAPISAVHVVVNAAVVVAGVAAAAMDGSPLADRLDEGLGASIAYLVFLAMGIAATAALMTTGADLLAVARSAHPVGAHR